ncbi:glutathione S-transferase T3-like [Oryza glaberrima]|uniref:glutathione S-transferase T3-like n=1 Tax=Oryza glaberrima TaxID=4538 RepID=UPI00224BE750|nr:glutathione S-transferase T3-like [Oryza glaberrima]
MQANSPNQVFGAASNRVLFAPHQVTSVEVAANTSSHGSESSIPCPTTTRQQEKQPLNIEELSDSSEEGVRRAPRTNWKEEENLRFVSTWLNNSVDSVDGNDKKSEYYWKDVADEFNSNRPRNAHTRTVKQMKTHGDNVKRDIAKFCGAYAQVRNTCTSGYSEDMIMEKAHAWYKNQSQQKPFTLEYMWRELKDQPKWRRIVKKEENKNKRTKISESGAYTSSSNQDTEEESSTKGRRPEGQKKAKERLKGKGKAASSPLGNQPSQNMVLYNEAVKIKSEALLKSAEAATKSAEAKREQIRMEKWQTYIKLEERDTSKFSPTKLRRHEAMLNQLSKELAQE